MAKYSDTDVLYARQIVDQLLSDERVKLDIEHNLVVSDLQRDIADFSNDLELLEEIGADVPAIQVAGEYLVPIALSSLGGPQWFGYQGQSWLGRWRHHPFFHEWVYYLFRSTRKDDGSYDNNITMSREEARSTVATRASDFLATRIAALRTFSSQEQKNSVPSLSILQQTGGAIVGTPGCNFSISTNSPGLRVFWSGAYRISPNYFSHPTTPISSVLQSGTYLFGVDGGAYGSVIQWDTSAVVSLPGSPKAHLNY
jgi:hypothetical protein